MQTTINEVLHWRDVKDEDFAHDLVDSAPRLARAWRVWGKDPSRAKQLVVAHFCGRRTPRWLFDYRDRAAATFATRNYFWGDSIGRDDAATVLDFRVRDPNHRGGYHNLGPDIDWRRGQAHLYGSSGWLVLHFWYWGLFAAAGYAMTRDPRYADVFTKFWQRWQQEYPFHVDLAAVRGGGSFSAEHSCMRAGRRLLVATDVLYSGLLGALDTDTAFDVLKYVWFVSRQYLRLPQTSSGRFVYHFGNHNLFDAGATPYCLGLAWPEFPHSRQLVDMGRACIRRHIRGSIHADGTSVEHSSRYAWYIANMYVQAVELARANGDRLLLPYQERKLRRFLWGLVELSAPNGLLIPYGDCQPPPDGLQLKTYRALFDDTATVERAAEIGVRLDTAYCPFSVRKADAPSGMVRRPWHVFRDSGIVLVRDGHGPEASALWLIADPRSRTGHSHLDFTSFQLWIRGEPLVQDTSGYGYRVEAVVPEERAFYYSPFGHSLLTVDDVSPVPMSRLGDVRGWWGGQNPEATVERVDVAGVTGIAVCRHNAYPGVVVRRTFRFDLAACWLEVEDRVALGPAARGKHTFRQLFHLGFGMRPTVSRSGVAACVRGSHGQARFAWSADAPVRVTSTRSVHAARAARVFGLPVPRILTAESVANGGEFAVTCRITWD
ncbi:MAG: hypothetical protein A3K19_13470 [Lentisphaerae bacterium RIFOXYB12_FULL_65_16]|nr:MAG: hypothetical protein A3K18_28990 [Lentisphaerae bacterium RIFOXYA12_64_32]OGV86302.1 MAG: hypothetical protein A3K19_13470 [Lentisphaerae bacterium RIFOXYB12_FULL_65_16]